MSTKEDPVDTVTPKHGSEPAIMGSPAPDRAEPPALWMDTAGVILECNPALETVLGYTGRELVSQHVSVVLPELSTGYVFRDGLLNPMLDFLSHLGHHFHARKRNGQAFGAELHFIENHHGEPKTIRLLVQPQDEGDLPPARGPRFPA
jgi:PAS domain S-box-containing protein